MSVEEIIAKSEKRKIFQEKMEAISAKLLASCPEDNTLRNEVIGLLQITYHDFNKARLAAALAAGALNGVAAAISSYEKNPVADVLVHAKFFAEKQALLIKESMNELG